MATIPTVRDAVAAAISSAPTFSGRVYSGWPGQINPPCAVVHRKQTNRNVEFSGGNQTTFIVSVFLVPTDLPTAQSQADGLLSDTGTNSLPALLEADTSLGGVANWLTVPQIDEEGLVEMAGVAYYSASISVIVSHN